MNDLEVKAKEYADDFYSNELEDEKLLFKKADIRLAYKQGFEDATKWYYPSKGEYPPEELYVLCELLDGTHEVGNYCPTKYKEYQDYEPPWDFGDYLEDDIKCWQYIVPPKER